VAAGANSTARAAETGTINRNKQTRRAGIRDKTGGLTLSTFAIRSLYGS